jgi:hypothetical protein
MGALSKRPMACWAEESRSRAPARPVVSRPLDFTHILSSLAQLSPAPPPPPPPRGPRAGTQHGDRHTNTQGEVEVESARDQGRRGLDGH